MILLLDKFSSTFAGEIFRKDVQVESQNRILSARMFLKQLYFRILSKPRVKSENFYVSEFWTILPDCVFWNLLNTNSFVGNRFFLRPACGFHFGTFRLSSFFRCWTNLNQYTVPPAITGHFRPRKKASSYGRIVKLWQAASSYCDLLWFQKI